MYLSEKQLNEFGGCLLTPDKLSDYENWALNLFHDEEQVSDPSLEMTVHLDLTKAVALYCEHNANRSETTLTAWLTWLLLQVFRDHSWTCYRKVNNEWYHFSRLPLYFPVAVGGNNRFNEPIIMAAMELSLAEFSREWQRGLSTPTIHDASAQFWSIAHIMGNLPGLYFTSCKLHQGRYKTGRPVFYFGKRRQQHGVWSMPLSINFDHATGDLMVLDHLVTDFQNRLNSDVFLR